MSLGLVVAEDLNVASWAFQKFNVFPMPVNKGIGVINTKTGEIVGAILFQNFNGYNLELSYYGQNTLTPGIVRTLARIAILEFNVSRVTVTVSKKKKRLIRSLHRFGYKLEGSQRRYYGARDCFRNTGIRFVLFREQIERLARLPVLQIEKQDNA